MDMAVAALLGVCAMIAFGILSSDDLMESLKTSGGPLALLFGGMVVA
jgi:Na+/H+ antiporter NhaD/arsenite permease-like protein